MELPYRMGRYTLLKKLANGGMAEIYLARYKGEENFSKLVAIKRILPDKSQGPQFIEMLKDEARALVRIQHQNIVQVYELGRDYEHLFISMEYVNGIDLGRLLRHVLSKGVEIPLKFVIHVVSQILQGLDCAHGVFGSDGRPLCLVHRDVSPPNILCSWNGEVKVADFGIAKGNHRTIVTVAHQLKGKYSYMSPEQASGKAVDHRTDLYAVGIILFELISGTRLYDDRSDLKVLEKVRRSRIPLSKIRRAPEDLAQICRIALSRDPRRRYRTAMEFMEKLNRCARTHDLVAYGFEFGRFLRQTFPGEANSEMSWDYHDTLFNE